MTQTPGNADRIAYGPDPNQFGDLRVPPGDGPFPVIIFIHGGFWRARYDLAHTAAACTELTRAGFATWNLEYRRLGQAGGGWPGTMDDVRSGAVHISSFAGRYQLDLARVAVAGHSAGGQLALWLASCNDLPVRAVIGLAPVSDLRAAWKLGLSNGVVTEYLGGDPKQVPDRYRAASPIELLPLVPGQRLLHGTADEDVPFELSQQFTLASGNAELIALEGAGHMGLVDPQSNEWSAVEACAFSVLCP